MILHEINVPYKYGETFILKPVFDVHLGNAYTDVTAFKRYLSDTDDHTFIIGGGDWLDCVITSDSKRYMKHVDSSASDAIIDDQINAMYEIMEPYKDRIIGIGTGNHEANINKRCSTHPARRLAKMLDTVSLGFSWMVRFRFRQENGGGRTLTIKGHHGWGGGSRTQGADLTKYSKDIAYWDSDLFLYGHTHKLQSDKIDRLSWVGKKLVSKPKYIYICGTWLKTLSNTDEATYSEQAGYPPLSIGNPNIKITPNRTWMDIEADV